MSQGVGTEFWAALKGEIEAAIETEESNRDSVLFSVDPGDTGAAYAKARAHFMTAISLKSLIEKVEKSQEVVERLNTSIAFKNNQIAELDNKSDEAPMRRRV